MTWAALALEGATNVAISANASANASAKRESLIIAGISAPRVRNRNDDNGRAFRTQGGADGRLEFRGVVDAHRFRTVAARDRNVIECRQVGARMVLRIFVHAEMAFDR